MIASGHWYTSGTFWAAAAVIVTVIFGVATIVLWKLGPPRRVVVYSVEDTSLLARSLPRQAGPELMVNYGDHALANPHIVILRVESLSRRDIPSKDFDGNQRLVFDIGTHVVAPVGESSEVIRGLSRGA